MAVLFENPFRLMAYYQCFLFRNLFSTFAPGDFCDN